MSDSEKQNTYYPKLTDFGKWVEGKVHLLSTGGRSPSGIRVQGYVQNGSYATAAIAKLRRSLGHDVGDDADIFEWTLEGMPERVARQGMHDATGTPTGEELAAHAALTLFAEHQHSVHTASMHTDEYVSLGTAVGRLAHGNANEAGVRRTFDSLQTAASWQELVRHARRLVALLKRERLALNYGLLAQDLLRLRSNRENSNSVRLRWGRDFNRAYYGLSRADEQSSRNRLQPTNDNHSATNNQ